MTSRLLPVPGQQWAKGRAAALELDLGPSSGVATLLASVSSMKQGSSSVLSGVGGQAESMRFGVAEQA